GSMRRRRRCTGGRCPPSSGPWASGIPGPLPAGITTAGSAGSRSGRAARCQGGRAAAMPDLSAPLPARRPELLIRPLGGADQYVVKDPRTRAFFHLGEAEHFLLAQLDGTRTAQGVCAAYAARFGEPLSEDELDEFVASARSQGLLREAE